MSKISIVIPIHDMENGQYFLWRVVNSILRQTFKDYEIIITKEGRMAENTNAGIRKATGELIKILFLDDYLTHENSLKKIVEHFDENDHWLVTGCYHQQEGTKPNAPHYPQYTDDIATGNNCIGSPSVLTFRREGCLFFDENMSWLLDCDLYKRYYEKYGAPKVLNDLNVTIGLGKHQTTNLLSEKQKSDEYNYLLKKYI